MKILAGMTTALGFFAVAFGAFGSHALKVNVSPEMLSVWQTAVQYQMFHVLALLSVILLGARNEGDIWNIVGWLFVLGCIIFSGSLYLLVISEIKAFGAITPIGGGFFLVGWVVFFFALIKTINKS